MVHSKMYSSPPFTRQNRLQIPIQLCQLLSSAYPQTSIHFDSSSSLTTSGCLDHSIQTRESVWYFLNKCWNENFFTKGYTTRHQASKDHVEAVKITEMQRHFTTAKQMTRQNEDLPIPELMGMQSS